MDKKELREKLKKIREKVLDKDYKSKEICSRVLELLKKQLTKKSVIFVYESMNSEVDTSDLIRALQNECVIAIPKVCENWHMVAIDIKTKKQLAKVTVAIVPLLGFNKDKHRIGYGKACYDNFFKENENVLKIGIAFSEQFCNFSQESHDIALDYIVTEKEIYS